MLTEEEKNRIFSFLKDNECNWVWIDITTNRGPTKVEQYFGEMFDGDMLNHWSPAVSEGYLEINGDKNIVIHWVVGERAKLVNINCVDEIDFDKIDKSLSSTIIHNSVIRIMSEKF